MLANVRPGGRSATMPNSADECRQRADECRRNAAQITDDVLRGTYLDLARRWRMMAHQAESLEHMMSAPKGHQAWHVQQCLGGPPRDALTFRLRAGCVLAPKKVVAAVAHWIDHWRSPLERYSRPRNRQ
jgi:hypothetical protein